MVERGGGEMEREKEREREREGGGVMCVLTCMDVVGENSIG